MAWYLHSERYFRDMPLRSSAKGKKARLDDKLGGDK